jgi:hypothetical protein
MLAFLMFAQGGIIDVAGTVAVEGGTTRPSFSLVFTPLNGGAEQTAKPQDNGRFGVSLPRGEYRVSAAGLPSNYRVKSIMTGSAELPDGRLRVDGTDRNLGMVVTLALVDARGYRVSGAVTGFLVSFARARPRVLLRNGASQLETFMDAEGVFEFPSVPRGSYDLTVEPILPAQYPSLRAMRVTVDRNLNDVAVVLPRVKEIKGRAVVSGDGPLRSIPLVVTGTVRSYPMTALVAPDGAFSITVPLGDVRVEIDKARDALPEGYTLESFSYGRRNLIAQPGIRVSAGDSDELRVAIAVTSSAVTLSFPTSTQQLPPQPKAWVRLRGRVTGLEGLNLSRSMEVTISDQTGVLQRTPVQSAGSFEFPKAPLGTHTIRVSAPQQPRVSRSVRSTDKDLDNIDFVWPRSKRVAGRIDVEGGGLVPRSYTFRLIKGDETFAVEIPSVPCDGVFNVALPEGEYRLLVGPPERYVKAIEYGVTDLLRSPLKVAAADTAELRITFVKGATEGAQMGRATVGSFLEGDWTGFLMGPPIARPDFAWLVHFQKEYGVVAPPQGQTMVSGCVTVESGRSLQIPKFSRWSLSFSGRTRVEAAVQPDGTFRVDLPEGEFVVTATGLPAGYSIKSIAGSEIAGSRIKVRSGAAFINVAVTLTGP